jgi:predicted RNA-binding protein YlqC (UPF0109 family)
MEKLKAILDKLIRGFTNHGSDLNLTLTELPGSTIISIATNADDYAKVVGTAGVTFKALEQIAALIGRRIEGAKVRLVLPKARVGTEKPLTPFVPDPAWNQTEEVEELLNEVLVAIGAGEIELGHADSDDTTVFGAQIAPEEPLPIPVVDISESLGKLFHAIGKARGRNIFVDVSLTEVEAVS